MVMTQKEIDDFISIYRETYGVTLFAISGNKDITDDTYLYHFVDDIGIAIIINPNTKSFKFSTSIDVFKLSSDDFSPLDYPDHFRRNYLRFRKLVREMIDKEVIRNETV